MRAITMLGIVLIVLGAVILAYQGITYTTREKVLEVGPVEVRKETQKTIPLPPLIGGVALAGGSYWSWWEQGEGNTEGADVMRAL